MKSGQLGSTDHELLNTMTVRGTRISVSHILECLAAGMDANDINESFETNFTQEVIAEVLQAASDMTAEPKIAAAG